MAVDHSDKYMVAPITRREDYSPTLWSVWMRPPEALTFKAGQYVAFGVDNNAKVFAHSEALRGAFNLTADEFDRVCSALGFDANTVLTLANISAIFRRGWLARWRSSSGARSDRIWPTTTRRRGAAWRPSGRR